MRNFSRVEAILQTSLAILPSWTRQATLELDARKADLDLLKHAGCYASTGVPAYKRSCGHSTSVRPDGGVSARALNAAELATFRGCYQDDVMRIKELECQLSEYARLDALVEHALGLVHVEIRLWVLKIYAHYPAPMPVATLNTPWCRETFDDKLSEALGMMARYLEPRVTENAFWRVAGMFPDTVAKKDEKKSFSRKKSLDVLVSVV